MKHLNKALLFVFTLTLYSQNFVKDLSNVVNQANLPTNYSGSAFVDIDGDGDQDIYSSLRFFFINDGNGNFTLEEKDIDQQSGGISNGVSFADIDNDGDMDLALAGSPSAIYYNENNALSLSADSPVSLDNKNYGWAAAWGDYDNDGFVDLINVCDKYFNDKSFSQLVSDTMNIKIKRQRELVSQRRIILKIKWFLNFF